METSGEEIRFAYQIHLHFGFSTHRRKPLFGCDAVAETLGGLLAEVCADHEYHLLEHHVGARLLRALVSLRPEHAPSVVAQHLKGVLSRRVKQAHPEAFDTVAGGKVWSGGYFCRSVGRARRNVVEGYVAGQWEHHGYTADILCRMKYRFEDPAPDGPIVLCYQVVLETERRSRLFEPQVTDGLVQHLAGAMAQQGCLLRAATFLPDHAHFSVRALPAVAPADLAGTLLAQGREWVSRNCVGVLKLTNAWSVWSPSAYVGTIGEATTDHIRNFLRMGD